jgi:polyisoprenoid-binding protein YceI
MGDWQLDPYHTQVEFAAKHLGMMTVRGHFADVTSTADIDPDHPEAMRVEVTIQAASIKTHNEVRDRDLRSENFLETDTFPVITFISTRVEPAGEDRYTVTGDLTIKGNTRSVALQMIKLGEFNDSMLGHRIGYNGHAKR